MRVSSVLAVIAVGAFAAGCTRPDDGASDTPAIAATATNGDRTGEKLVRVNDFLSYSPDGRLVRLRLVAGYSDTNNALNFNGATKGAHTVTVPVGWRVESVVENRADLPHSAVVLTSTPTLPAVPGTPAFSGARTADAAAGAGEMTSTPLVFVADRAGSYQVVCGVPYHGRTGMWIGLVVSDTVTAPTYTLSPAR